ncbi:hypothetical protein TNCV_4422641 [Trichonephila clavipes]|nr:hypothetical protein TNCV_4422641 [Trichonephila clavipes]
MSCQLKPRSHFTCSYDIQTTIPTMMTLDHEYNKEPAMESNAKEMAEMTNGEIVSLDHILLKNWKTESSD